jgi:hypothetical protein
MTDSHVFGQVMQLWFAQDASDTSKTRIRPRRMLTIIGETT